MSLSTEGAGEEHRGEHREEHRGPTCTRCRQHGLIVPLKGHKKLCPRRSCSCGGCRVIARRAELKAARKRARRAERGLAGKPAPEPSGTRTGTGTAPARPGAATPRPGSGHLHPATGASPSRREGVRSGFAASYAVYFGGVRQPPPQPPPLSIIIVFRAPWSSAGTSGMEFGSLHGALWFPNFPLPALQHTPPAELQPAPRGR